MSGRTIVRKLPEMIDRISEEPLSVADNITSDTGLPIIPDPRSGSPLWIDLRELRLRYAIPVKGVEEFFKGLREGELRTARCRRCGTTYFPPQPDCPRCRARDMEWIRVDGDGELITWTMIVTKPLTFSHHKDYVVGIARMPQGFNILAWIRTEDPSKLAPGTRVRLRIGRREDEGYITYWFEPLSTQ